MKHSAWKLVKWLAKCLLRNRYFTVSEDIFKYTKSTDASNSFPDAIYALVSFLCYGRWCYVACIVSPIAFVLMRLLELQAHLHVVPASCHMHGFCSSPSAYSSSKFFLCQRWKIFDWHIQETVHLLRKIQIEWWCVKSRIIYHVRSGKKSLWQKWLPYLQYGKHENPRGLLLDQS